MYTIHVISTDSKGREFGTIYTGIENIETFKNSLKESERIEEIWQD